LQRALHIAFRARSITRRKIGEGYIRTVRGVGYVIDKVAAKGGG